MNERRRTDFLKKFAENRYTEDEHREFIHWVNNASSDEIGSVMDTYREIADQLKLKYFPDPALADKIEAKLDALEFKEQAVRSSHWKSYYRTAAVILVVLSTALYFYRNRQLPAPVQVRKQQAKINDVAPGSNIAILTLADGSKISLDDASKGEIAEQSGIKITKTADGELIYDVSSKAVKNNKKDLFNSIATPRGGQYQVNLPDGSKVWLNAQSSLKYPVSFSDVERKVQLNGEAYFEVAHNKARPFIVETSNQTVEVLGTHFNINSYSNEPVVKTTLLEGSVKITHTYTHSSQFLNPGQEASTTEKGAIILAPADITQAIAWKNGNFLFNDMDLVNIMRQLERWYDVDVDYSNIPPIRYNGLISRNVNLSQVLKMLEVTGQVKFKIQGKSIQISN